MKLSSEDKKAIYAEYVDWVSQVADDLEDKSVFTSEELVNKVIQLVEERLVWSM